MSDSPLPEYVDTRKIFTQASTLSGSIGLSRLNRIKEYLAEDDISVQAELRFSVDDSGRKHIVGELKASLPVECQRCLEPLRIELADEFNLVLVADETVAKSLEKQYDPLVVEENKIYLADLIDEQLVLAMPIVNYHQSGPCSEAKSYATEQTETEDMASDSPFAVLATLKK